MRLNPTLVLAFVLSMSGPAVAQDWSEYQNIQDGFKINFPGQPKIAATRWKSEYGYMLPARAYTAERGRERYSLTVVDYNSMEQQGTGRGKLCPPGAETCIGSQLSGPGHWRHDVRGVLVYASFTFIQRDAKVTHYLWGHQDLVEGHQLHLTNNADQSRTFVYIAMHEMKLYILEGTVPKGYPAPALFQQSLGWVDKDGNGIRYQTIYANQFYGLKELPPPSRAGGGRGADGGRGGAGAGNVGP